ncbi:hypothetical protein ACKVMT_06290 [Halobacteriales archaeon Cl-PHB]
MATSDTTEVPPPDFIWPGIRCALEMALVGFVILYVGLPATNVYYVGAVVVLALVAMVVVLFWALNRQMEAWIARARRTGAPSDD